MNRLRFKKSVRGSRCTYCPPNEVNPAFESGVKPTMNKPFGAFEEVEIPEGKSLYSLEDPRLKKTPDDPDHVTLVACDAVGEPIYLYSGIPRDSFEVERIR